MKRPMFGISRGKYTPAAFNFLASGVPTAAARPLGTVGEQPGLAGDLSRKERPPAKEPTGQLRRRSGSHLLKADGARGVLACTQPPHEVARCSGGTHRAALSSLAKWYAGGSDPAADHGDDGRAWRPTDARSLGTCAHTADRRAIQSGRHGRVPVG